MLGLETWDLGCTEACEGLLRVRKILGFDDANFAVCRTHGGLVKIGSKTHGGLVEIRVKGLESKGDKA